MRINEVFVLCLVGLCSSNEDKYQKAFDVPEGSSCTWNGLHGTCTNIMHCRSARDGLRRNIYPPTCSFEGTIPVVCCTDCELKHSTTLSDAIGKRVLETACPGSRRFAAADILENTHNVTTQYNIHSLTYINPGRPQKQFPSTMRTPSPDFQVDSRFNKTGNKARDNCLKYLENLDYPCSFASRTAYEESRHLKKNCYDYMEPSALENAGRKKRHSYLKPNIESQIPDTVHVAPPISAGINAMRNQYPHMALLGFGDDLETAQWLCGGSVISEKYILTAAHCISSPAVGPVKYIALGILKRSDPPKLWQKYNVKRIIAHPEYQPPSKYNDIALLETEETIFLNFRVLPACLHLQPESDETAEATGWGALGNHQQLADTLQTVKLQRYDEAKCAQLYPKHRLLRHGYNHTSQMCYGDTEVAKDTCQGDSGGPLQTANEFLRCAYTVLGVTSYGRQCGISAGSGIYTRVYHYVPWIESVVWL